MLSPSQRDHLQACCCSLIEAISDRKRMKLIKALEKKIAKTFKAQRKDFVAKFKAMGGDVQEAKAEDWLKLWKGTAKKTAKVIVDDLDAAYEPALEAGALHSLGKATTGITFDVKSPAVVDWLDKRGAAQVAGINDHTEAQLRTLITSGREAGQSHSDIAKSIAAKFDGFGDGTSSSRAYRVAVTEIGSAYCRGQLEQGKQLADVGLDMEKSWVASGGSPCEICAGNAAQGWIPMDEAFESGDDCPLGHPNCFCDLRARLKRDRSG